MAFPALAIDQTGNQFWEDRKRGYFWYEDPVFEEPVQERGEAHDVPFPTEKNAQPKVDTYTYEDLFNLHPDQFQVVIDQRLKHAVHKPTEENVKRCLEATDVAKKKSRMMANVAGHVALQNPQLTGESSYPVSQPGRKAFIAMRSEEIQDVLDHYKDQYAIVAFYQPGCSYCTAQDEMLEHFRFLYQWQVRKLDIHENPEMAARFNVTITPTLLLVSREKQKEMLLASGVISFEELSERVYRVVRMLEGLSDPEHFYDMEFQKRSEG